MDEALQCVYSVFLCIFLTLHTYKACYWAGSGGNPGASEEKEGQIRQRDHWVYNSCLEFLLQIEMSLQMQEHSVPMQL